MTTWTRQLEYATNLVTYSEDISLGTWVVNTPYTNIYNNSALSPFGEMTATIMADESADYYGEVYLPYTLSGGTARTFSLFVKKDDVTDRVMAILMRYTETAVTAEIFFDTSTGEYVTYEKSGTTLHGAGVDDYNTYWRIWISSSSDSYGFTSVNILPAVAQDLVTASDVAITGTITVFGAQLEVGTEPTGYIFTDGAATRVEKLTEWVSQ